MAVFFFVHFFVAFVLFVEEVVVELVAQSADVQDVLVLAEFDLLSQVADVDLDGVAVAL